MFQMKVPNGQDACELHAVKRDVEGIDVSQRRGDYCLTAGVAGTQPHHRDMTSLLGDCPDDNRMSKTESKFILSSYNFQWSLIP